MKRLSTVIGAAGGILAAAGLLLYLILPQYTIYITLLEGTGAFFLIVFFIVHFEAFRAFSIRRSTRFGANSFLMTVLFLGILILVNFILSRHYFRIDLTEAGEFTLSPQTVKVLQSLPREVRVTAFFKEGSPAKENFKKLIGNYRYHTDRLKVHYVDPDRQPGITRNYGVTQYGTTILESGKKEIRITKGTEEDLTNALIKVTHDRSRVICFLEGHGEHRIDDRGREGYSLARDALEKQGFSVKSLLLMQKDSVPEACAVLVLAGPKKMLLPQETEAISDYEKKGGQLLVLADPGQKAGLSSLLTPWGAYLDDNLILDPLSRLFGGDNDVPLINEYPSHPITRGFNLATFFPDARSIGFDEKHSDTVEFTPLARTTPQSWGETHIENGRARFDPGADQKGPLTVAGIYIHKKTQVEGGKVEKQKKQKAASSTEKSRLVLLGDSDFASNADFNVSGNGDFFQNILNYLAREENLISIRPRKARPTPLHLTPAQGRFLFYVPVIVLPMLILGAGITIWRKRKHL